MNVNSITCSDCLNFRRGLGMLRISLDDLYRPKFSTKISTGLVEIFDGFRDGNLTSKVAEPKATPNDTAPSPSQRVRRNLG